MTCLKRKTKMNAGSSGDTKLPRWQEGSHPQPGGLGCPEHTPASPPASPIPRGGPRAAGRSRPSPLWPGVLTSAGLQATWAVTRRGGGVDEQLLEQRPKSEGGGEASPGPTHCPGQQRTGPKLIRVAGRLGGRSWPAWWLHGGGQWARGSPLRSTFTWEVGSTQDTETPGGGGLRLSPGTTAPARCSEKPHAARGNEGSGDALRCPQGSQ